MANELKIDDLIKKSRFPDGFGRNLAILLYFPIGLMLAVIRVFIGLHVYIIASILPKTSSIRRMVLRVMYTVLGLVVTQNGTENHKRDVKIMISNHISIFDHLAIDLFLPNYMPFALRPLGLWGKLLGYIDFYSKKTNDSFVSLCKQHIAVSDVSLLVFPEGMKTNGEKGLLKYNTKIFSPEQPIQPIALEVRRPSLTDISVTVINGSWLSDAFWFLFVPYSHYDVRILPVIEPGNQTEAEFSLNAQKLTANALKLVPTSLTAADMVEHEKKCLLLSQQQHRSTFSNVDAIHQSNLMNSPTLITRGSLRSSWRSSSHEEDERIRAMCEQVKEVLPHVPIHAIRKDLAITRDIDITISNILEDRVHFIPENESKPTAVKKPPVSQSTPQKPIAAKSFPRSSKERHMSLEDRKRILVETARQRYLAKHGITGQT
ncbi:lipid droplet-regulating VLDL assembly factor AUP1-like isoform X2 [Tubulanus polymorphus]|uniref:lipid droplet-regulating VLDL assembly factor AUP1-like isoform X2 n=1 Tax=Tubulanus polymorphus TaxID=672921 RepID=UPI003DA60D25